MATPVTRTSVTHVVEKPTIAVTNWAVILNAGLLAIVIIGAWFSTFSSPLNDKFISLEKNLNAISNQKDHDIAALRNELLAQIVSQEKTVLLAQQANERLNNEYRDSVSRRFLAQDTENTFLQDQVIRRFGEQGKINDELKLNLKESLTETEKRRVEVATKADLTTSLGASRLEFLAEVKRVDQQATSVAAASMSRNEFNVWKSERDTLSAQLWKRVENLETTVLSNTRSIGPQNVPAFPSYQSSSAYAPTPTPLK